MQVLGAHRSLCFFFNDTATTEIYTLSLHDALPILILAAAFTGSFRQFERIAVALCAGSVLLIPLYLRSEEHTSELQSHLNLVCRLLLAKKTTCCSRTTLHMPTRLPCSATVSGNPLP